MTQQGDMTSRPPGGDASVAGLPATEPGTASFPPEPAAQPAPWFPSPYLAEGQAAPEAYPAPARPGQPKYGEPPAAFHDGRQAGFRQPGYGRQRQAGGFGQPARAGRPGPGGRTMQAPDPAVARGWERLLAMTVDWLLILAVAFLILYAQMERFFHQAEAVLSNSQFVSQSATNAALGNFLTRPSTLSTQLSYSLVVYGLAIVCFWILQATTGATLGKLLVGLRVVSAGDRTRAGLRATGLRTAVFLVGPAIFTFAPLLIAGSGLVSLVGAALWFADCAVLLSDPERRALHDRAAGTLVVRKPRGGSRSSW